MITLKTSLRYLFFRCLFFVAIAISGLIGATASHAQEQDADAPKRENLGPNVNTAFEELCPVISPDGKTLYFVREGTPDNVGGKDDQDIWYSTLRADGTWSLAVHMPAPLNDSGNNIVASVSPDGNTLLLLNIYNLDGTGGEGFSYTHRTKTGWSFPQKVEIPNYYNNDSHTSAILSPDQKTIIMSVERKDTYGARDLYFSRLSDDGTWTEPVNLGSDINTSGVEGTPSLASDGKTLYFSSDGHGGYGDRDIFFAKRLDDTWTHWSTPENMGPTINTSGWDGYYTVPASGEYAYLVSDVDSYGQEDIIRVRLPKKLKPNPVLLVSGHVLNTKTNEPIGATITYSSLAKSKELGTAQSDPSEGKFKIVLPAGDRYAFHAEAPGYYPITENVDASGLTEYQELKRDLRLVPIEKNSVIRLNNIFFEFAKADLKPESYPELDRVVEFMKKNPKLEVEIAGHTDSIGNAQANVALSKARAQSVTDYVVRGGIPVSRITAKGYGKSKPIASNSSEEGRQENRRVEFTILKD